MAEVTIAILTLNEERNLPDLLDSLVAQQIDPARFQVLIVDNGSSDSTKSVALSYALRLPNLGVIDNPRRGIAISRNLALARADTPLIAFIDADCVAPPHWVGRLLDGFAVHSGRNPGVVAVGGGNVPLAGQGRFMDALGITLRSFFGSHGSAQGMLFSADREVEHIPTLNIMYDRQAVLQAGGFDEKFLMVCEDPELNHRLVSAGRRIVFLADCVVQHKMRPDLRKWLANVKLYGRGRSHIIRKHPDHWRLKFAVPPMIVLALALSPLGLLWRPLLLPLLYFATTAGLAAALVGRERRWDLLGWVWVILSLNPIAYGLGMLQGVFDKR